MEYYLWQLYHIDAEAKHKRAEMGAEVAKADRLAQAHAAAEAKVRTISCDTGWHGLNPQACRCLGPSLH